MATAPDPAPTKQIEELLTCCICTETLDEPKTLPCFHSFCKKCLAKYIEVQREKAQKERRVQLLFHCPTCRTLFELREGDSVERIPPNYFINNLLEILPVIQQQTQKLRCESCKAQAPATCRCIECERYLCKNCLTAHNNWLDFDQHLVMTLEELAKPENQSKAKGKPRCKKQGHGNKHLEFYCNTCQELACINCVVLNHSQANHDYQPVDTVADKHKESLETASANLQVSCDEVKATLQKIDQATQNLQVNTKKAKDMILQQEKEILQKLTQKVKRNTAVLLEEVDRAHNMLNQQLVKQHNQMKAYFEKVNGSLDFAKNIIEKASNDEILLLSPEIQINARDIKKECPEMMEPIHDGAMKYQAETSEAIVGKVKLDKPGNVGFGPLRGNINPVQRSLSEISTILEGNIEHAKQLVEWMKETKFGWHLCYRASRDGWDGGDFHRKCDDVGPTLTLVKCGTNIFGGFTDQSWNHREIIEFKRSNASFLFSLKNKENMRPFKCPIKDGKNDKAICCSLIWAATFGNHDLVISSNAITNQDSHSNLGKAYQPPPGYEPGAPETRALLAGSYKFTPSEIEVFHS